MKFISWSGNSLEQLQEKLVDYQRVVYSEDSFHVLSEYLQIDQNIECLWLKIHTAIPLEIQVSSPNDDIPNLQIYLINSPLPLQYRLENTPTQKIKQGVLQMQKPMSYQLLINASYQGEWLLVNFLGNWSQEYIQHILHIQNSTSQLRLIHSHYFMELRSLSQYTSLTEKFIRKSIMSQVVFQVISDLLGSHQKNQDSGIEQVKMYLLAHLDTPFPSLEFLADIGNMSVSQLKNKFRQIEAASPQQFFIEKRLASALEYLNAGLSVKETALSIGYSNPSNFINAFKRKFGKSPLEFIKHP
jgi:AraC-like DNA-binding protein